MKNETTAVRNITILSWFNFLEDLRFYGPVAVLCFQRICGSYALAMGVFGVTMFSSVLFEVPTGLLSDRVGRRPTLIYGQIAGFASVLAYAIAGSGAGSIILFIGAALEGISRAFFSGNNNALLHDSLKLSDREREFHKILGKLSSYFQLAAAVSAVAGGAFAYWSFSIVLWLSVVPQAAALVLSFLIVEPGPIKDADAKKDAERGLAGSFRHLIGAAKAFFSKKRIVVVASAGAVSGALGESAYQFSSAFFAVLWPAWALGFSKLLSSLGAALSFRLSGRAIDRFGEFPVLIVSRSYGRIVGTIAALFPGPHSPLLMASSSLFFGTGVIANETILQKEFSDSQRATMGSIGAMLESVMFAVAAPLLGFMADRVGPIKAYLLVQLAMIPVVLIIWLEFRRRDKNKLQGPDGK